MSTESIIIKAFVITVLSMLVMLTPKTHATEMSVPAWTVATEGTSHACP